MSDWQPAASNEMLLARAALYRRIRAFFEARGVLEVDTPLLARSIGTDPALDPIIAQYHPSPGAAQQTLFLQTSPEFAMKRLLAAGSGPIYQLGKAFRNGESGRRHNPEFTMLEWYRPGFTLEDLMDEVEALAIKVLGPLTCHRRSYGELFEAALGLNPYDASTPELQALVQNRLDLSGEPPDHATCLDLLYSHCIEPGLQDPIMIVDYPAAQAALAKVAENDEGQLVARRFEFVMRGMEIANGYDELLDASEQAHRFAGDQLLRKARGLPQFPHDRHLLAALGEGLPPCSGVALGVDRLLMLQTAASSIDEVLAFPLARV
jgi:lysyl-tRNA synthetase class 2